MDLQRFKAACVRIEAAGEIGSGYLVAADVVATCQHVVKNAPPGGAVALTFYGDAKARSGTVISADPALDVALVRFAPPLAAVEPLPLRGGCAEGDKWQSFGYPFIAGTDGDVFAGTVRDTKGLKSGQAVINLFCEEAAAGMAAKVSGLSGSPVLVGDHVVGHVSEVRTEALRPGQTAWGRIYAVPALEVMRLAGFPASPALAPAAAPGPVSSPPASGAPAAGDFDVFVSYRSSDAGFAKELVSRLEGSGLRAFFAPTELEPGAVLANRLQAAIARSRAGVVLVSRAWLASPWCQEEANALLVRAVSGDFPVIPLALEDLDMPPLLAGRVWLDFRTQRAAGPELARLTEALRRRAAPAESAAAATSSPKPSTGAEARFQLYQEASRSPADAALLGAQALLDIGEPAAALQRLREAGEGARALQLRALALARCGRKEDAVAILEPLYEGGQVDAETGGILGGRYKQLWLEGGTPNLLDRSFRVYLETWRKAGDVYPGVNALAMALWLQGEAPVLFTAEDAEALEREREEIGRRCLAIGEGESDPWRLATRAEFHLLDAPRDAAALGLAKRFYGLAASKFGDRYQNIAVMRRQARRNLAYLKLGAGEVDALLPVPAVVAFTGHMTDAPGRDPRFPQTKVRAVREAVRAYLHERRVGFGFVSAARGSDLIFAEEVLKRGGRVRVFLPFPESDFKQTSVGLGWDAAFDGVLGHERVTKEVLKPAVPAPANQPDAYAACNRAVRNAACQQAELMDQSPRLLAVWNGRPGDGAGGAADAITEWTNAALGEVDVIDIGKL